MKATPITLFTIIIIVGALAAINLANPLESTNSNERHPHEYNYNSTLDCTKEVRVHFNSDATTIMECCKGYKPYKHDPLKCIPHCPDGCENGHCVGPNFCNCFSDHVRSHEDKCVPTCPISCLNGVCDSNGTCTCNPQYTLDPFRKFCMPICRGSCGINRFCSSPGKCSCIRGFKENPFSGECDPVCPFNCLNGRCISPGLCSCRPGYRLLDDVCQGNCTNCENGMCVTDNICTCNPGYTFHVKRQKCVPVCKGCINGICTLPEVCQCNDGYEKVDGKCIPFCEGGCHNGYCVKPNACNCRDGYARTIFGNCRRMMCKITDATKSICTIKHLG